MFAFFADKNSKNLALRAYIINFSKFKVSNFNLTSGSYQDLQVSSYKTWSRILQRTEQVLLPGVTSTVGSYLGEGVWEAGVMGELADERSQGAARD